MEIDGLGLRDHSWGPRYWQAIHRYRWLTINFAPDFGMMVSTVWRDEEHRSQGGVVYRGDKMDQIVGVDIDTAFEDNGLFHKDLVAHLKLNTGEQLDVSGKVMGFIPLRNRREGMTTHVGEGMTEFRCGDAVGYGLANTSTRSNDAARRAVGHARPGVGAHPLRPSPVRAACRLPPTFRPTPLCPLRIPPSICSAPHPRRPR